MGPATNFGQAATDAFDVVAGTTYPPFFPNVSSVGTLIVDTAKGSLKYALQCPNAGIQPVLITAIYSGGSGACSQGVR